MPELSDLIPGDHVTRSEWGAPARPGGQRRELEAVERAVLHWTTGKRLGRRAQASWVKAIYDYHTGVRGWADVGYSYLVDRYGNVYDGRARYRVGAHARGHNIDSVGIALLGGSAKALTAEAKDAIRGLLEWLEATCPRFDPEATVGHRDLGDTTCPGPAAYSWVQAGLPAPDGGEDDDPDEGQPDDDGKPDYVVAVTASPGVDEGAARVLGAHYAWRYLALDADVPYADRLEDVSVGTLVRVGAARRLDRGELADLEVAVESGFHDVGGSDRAETAAAVAERIAAREGDSRSVT